MKRSRVYPLAVSLLLVVLVVSGCAAPKTASVPTTAPLSCPTTAPLSCPTPAVQAVPEMNGWRLSMSSNGNVVLTIDKGDKCSIVVKSPLTAPEINYEIVVKDTTYQNYMIVGLILEPGKTLADLEAWTSVESGPPWSQGVGIDIVNSATRTAISRSIPIEGQLYFTCFVQGPDALRIIGSVGPIEVPKE